MKPKSILLVMGEKAGVSTVNMQVRQDSQTTSENKHASVNPNQFNQLCK